MSGIFKALIYFCYMRCLYYMHECHFFPMENVMKFVEKLSVFADSFQKLHTLARTHQSF